MHRSSETIGAIAAALAKAPKAVQDAARKALGDKKLEELDKRYAVIAEQMNLCSGNYPSEVDEFQLSGLTPVACDIVRPPRVLESHVNMECKAIQVIEVSTRPWGGSLVLGQIVRFHVDDAIIDSRFHIDPDKLRAIGRMGGTSYSRTRDRFDMIRPA